MTITRYEPDGRKCQAVVHGDTIYLAGQIGEGDGIAEQTRNALAEVERLLALTGGTKSDILSVTVWLADMDDFDGMNAVYDAWVDPNNQPTRACGESRLGAPEFLVEFMVIAAKR
ncbi:MULTISPECIES: RidA family protein [unclassified Roseovarius]|uniref:RidA family protein n=1 Tax=unclassified Roseovarius TaxID=2614913 RepID=UPI00273F85ED|nr:MULTISPECIES: RidA family protein [unclassified Roseovarius]